tara:strand:+ start:339 stop:713 length:375 start_codon:yes stop_codon:yes gene_type:complete
MKITKRQLRNLIREACHLGSEDPVEELPAMMPDTEMAPPAPAPDSASNVPVPEDYQATRNFLDQNPDMVDLALQGIMDAVGSGCQRSTAQAVVDHMQELLSGSDDASTETELEQGLMDLMGMQL